MLPEGGNVSLIPHDLKRLAEPLPELLKRLHGDLSFVIEVLIRQIREVKLT
jgi:hypothetical protein